MSGEEPTPNSGREEPPSLQDVPPSYGAPPQGAPPPYGMPPAYGPPPSYAPPALPYGPGTVTGPLPPLAHRGKRLLARMIDFVIMTLTAMALAVPWIMFVAHEDPYGETTWTNIGVAGMVIILAATFFLYEGLQLAMWGKTLGKRWLGLRVVLATPPGAPLPTGRALGRAAVYPPGFMLVNVIPILGLLGLLNVLSQFWDEPLHQCLHDKIAGTMVIDGRSADRALAGAFVGG
ncbi:RDD family protein [Actinoallomurus purpureus]|uniref:RDD family protein n=1 Tax=Actinoallomurus purpureus TaxID=478114 RepID=UPI002091F435|nr:RDD family protein [Actinoallomurus purpureus]MCO6005708.1 RDD family protein [Actinoallomurus purpureus]